MAELLAAGRAQSVGGLPDPPICHDGGYWRPADGGWQRVTDDAVIGRLADDARRWQLATTPGPANGHP